MSFCNCFQMMAGFTFTFLIKSLAWHTCSGTIIFYIAYDQTSSATFTMALQLFPFKCLLFLFLRTLEAFLFHFFTLIFKTFLFVENLSVHMAKIKVDTCCFQYVLFLHVSLHYSINYSCSSILVYLMKCYVSGNPNIGSQSTSRSPSQLIHPMSPSPESNGIPRKRKSTKECPLCPSPRSATPPLSSPSPSSFRPLFWLLHGNGTLVSFPGDGRCDGLLSACSSPLRFLAQAKAPGSFVFVSAVAFSISNWINRIAIRSSAATARSGKEVRGEGCDPWPWRSTCWVWPMCVQPFRAHLNLSCVCNGSQLERSTGPRGAEKKLINAGTNYSWEYTVAFFLASWQVALHHIKKKMMKLHKHYVLSWWEYRIYFSVFTPKKEWVLTASWLGCTVPRGKNKLSNLKVPHAFLIHY